MLSIHVSNILAKIRSLIKLLTNKKKSSASTCPEGSTSIISPLTSHIFTQMPVHIGKASTCTLNALYIEAKYKPVTEHVKKNYIFTTAILKKTYNLTFKLRVVEKCLQAGTGGLHSLHQDTHIVTYNLIYIYLSTIW